MIVPDVNLIIYAEIDAHANHVKARSWWQKQLGASEIGFTPPTIFGFIRLATNPRIFAPALAVADALERVGVWLARPNARMLVPGPRYLDIAFGLLRTIGAAGNLSTDAQIAAFAIENAATVCSADADFSRFPGLAWSNPLA